MESSLVNSLIGRYLMQAYQSAINAPKVKAGCTPSAKVAPAGTSGGGAPASTSNARGVAESSGGSPIGFAAPVCGLFGLAGLPFVFSQEIDKINHAIRVGLDKHEQEQRARARTEKTTHEVDAFSSESTEVMVDTRYGSHSNTADKTGKTESDEKEEDKKKKCIMTENADPSDDEDSEQSIRIVLVRMSPTVDGAITGSYHLVRRLTRYLRVAGMVSYVQHAYKNPQLGVLQPGLSQTKDQVCKIKDHHASHVVRLQVSPSVDCLGLIYIVLRSYLGHTHCVHQSFNLRIGKELDSLQGSLLGTLLSINWAREKADNLSLAACQVLTSIKDAWLELLKKAINSRTYSIEQSEELDKAYRFINAMSLRYLYNKTHVGPVYMQEEFKKLLDELEAKIKQNKKP